MHPMFLKKKMVDQRLNRQQKTFEDTLGKLCIKLDKIKWIELLMQFYSKHFFSLVQQDLHFGKCLWIGDHSVRNLFNHII